MLEITYKQSSLKARKTYIQIKVNLLINSHSLIAFCSFQAFQDVYSYISCVGKRREIGDLVIWQWAGLG